MVATDFFTAEVWTLGGLVTYYVLFFLHLGSRQIHVAGVTRVPLPPRSPNLNAYAERWVRSVKEEALSRLILFGERASDTHSRKTSPIIITREITREKAMSCFFLRQEQTKGV